MARIVIKQGDLRPSISATLTDSTGAAIDLTSATSVKFIMKSPTSSSAKISTAGVIETAASGIVSYTWNGTDTDTVGTYNAEFEVDWGSGVYQTFPADGYLEVEVVADLGGDA